MTSTARNFFETIVEMSWKPWIDENLENWNKRSYIVFTSDSFSQLIDVEKSAKKIFDAAETYGIEEHRRTLLTVVRKLDRYNKLYFPPHSPLSSPSINKIRNLAVKKAICSPSAEISSNEALRAACNTFLFALQIEDNQLVNDSIKILSRCQNDQKNILLTHLLSEKESIREYLIQKVKKDEKESFENLYNLIRDWPWLNKKISYASLDKQSYSSRSGSSKQTMVLFPTARSEYRKSIFKMNPFKSDVKQWNVSLIDQEYKFISTSGRIDLFIKIEGQIFCFIDCSGTCLTRYTKESILKIARQIISDPAHAPFLRLSQSASEIWDNFTLVPTIGP